MTSASHRPQIRRTLAMMALAGCVTLLAGIQPAHAARDYVWAAGSSTTFPFATRVSEQFARKTGMKAPKVESLGTGGGIKMFCSGVGDSYPDIATASRRMKRSEFDAKTETLSVCVFAIWWVSCAHVQVSHLRALKAYQEATKMNPAFAAAYTNLGTIYQVAFPMRFHSLGAMCA